MPDPVAGSLVGSVWAAWLAGLGVTGRGTEAFLEEAFVDLACVLPIRSAVEVGAHEATFSRRVAARRPDIEVTALEANPVVYQQYTGQLSGIRYLNVAATRTEGPVQLVVPRLLTTRGGEVPLGAANRMGSMKSLHDLALDVDVWEVDGVPLDAVLAGGQGPYALWIDVEGATMDVLQGAEATMREALCLYVELESRSLWDEAADFATVDAHLEALGMSLVARDAATPHMFNAVYVPRVLVGQSAVRDFVEGAVRRVVDSAIGAK